MDSIIICSSISYTFFSKLEKPIIRKKNKVKVKELKMTMKISPRVMRIMKLAKYRLKVQVEKDEGSSGEGRRSRVEKDESPEAETLSRLLIVAEGPD